MIHSRKKYVPTFFGFNNYECKHEDFYCYYEEAIWNKYGLHFTIHDNSGQEEDICIKGKKHSKPPYAFNSYEEMMIQTEKHARGTYMADQVGNIRKKAVYLILDLDKNGILRSDPYDFDGYVSKRGTIFNITSEGTYNGKKWFKLKEEDKHLVFPDIVKAATYIEKHYGHWACSHYLKNIPGNY